MKWIIVAGEVAWLLSGLVSIVKDAVEARKHRAEALEIERRLEKEGRDGRG
jgi:hypothetical protein